MLRSLLLSSLTTLPLLAQQPAPTPTPVQPADAAARAQDPAAPKAAAGPSFVLQTTHAEMAEGLAENAGVELPALQDGQHWMFTMDDGGKLQVKAANGAAGLFRLQLRPRQLMDIFGDKVEEAKQQALMIGGMMMAQSGIKPKDTADVIEFVFGLPKQIDALTVDVQGSKENGFDGDLTVQPVEGTWAGKIVAALKAGSGAPAVPDQDAALRIRSNLTTTALDQLIDPFINLIAGQGAQTDEERKQNLELFRQSTRLMAGPFAMSMSPQGGMVMLMALTDPKAYAELMHSEKYREYAKRTAEANPAVEVEFEPKAFEHKGVTVSKTTMDMGAAGGMNPLMPDGKMEVHTAVAGNYAITTQFGATAATVKNVIEKALQNEIGTQALPGGALMTMNVKLATLVEGFMGGMGMGAGDADDMPQSIDGTLSKEGSTLRLKVKVK